LGSDAIRLTLRRMKTARRIDPGRRLGIAHEDLDLRSEDGVRLAAWWVPTRPGVVGPAGWTAVVHHHYGGQRATALPWIRVLWEHGIPTLAFDARGHGASDPSPAGAGDFVSRAADVRAAVAELRRRGARRILGVGQSQGGAVLVMGLRRVPELGAVVLDSGPAPDMGSAAWGLAGNMLEATEQDDPAARVLLAARILPGTRPLRYLPALWRALAELRTLPLLWLHGGADRVIPEAAARCWWRALAPADGRWRRCFVPGGEHVRLIEHGGHDAEGAVRWLIAELPPG
jgi:pimeloyl-ACP methyl ester carboxylesterase